MQEADYTGDVRGEVNQRLTGEESILTLELSDRWGFLTHAFLAVSEYTGRGFLGS